MNLSNELLTKITIANNKTRISKENIDANLEILSNLFSKGESCAICGSIWYESGSSVEVDHLKTTGHEKVKSIQVEVNNYYDFKNIYAEYVDDYSHRPTKEGLCIYKHRLHYFQATGKTSTNTERRNGQLVEVDITDYDNTLEYELTSHNLNIHQKKWILKTIDKFLSNYLKYTEEISKEYSEIEELAEKKINAIIEVLRNE